MIYEMFKAFAVDGLGWGEFAIAVVVTVLLVHLLCWAAGVLASSMYYYVQDGQEEIQNFMWTLWSKVWPETDATKAPKPVLNGWYKSSQLGLSETWRYREFDNGKEIDQDDYKAGVYKSAPAGWNKKDAKCYRDKHILLGSPIYLAAAFLIFDLLPVFVVSIAAIYSTLRLTRTVVRISKRVTKVEEEVTTVSEPSD